jgi:hypothetical protein
MTDVEYVIAAYAVVLGGLGLYAVTLWRRLRRATSDDDEAR